jgi:hypothetical protein
MILGKPCPQCRKLNIRDIIKNMGEDNFMEIISRIAGPSNLGEGVEGK